MKFDKNERAGKEPNGYDKNQFRKKIWKNPAIIEKLFANSDWEKFDSESIKNKVPSASMLNQIQAEIKNNELKKQRKKQTIKLLSYGSAAAACIVLMLSFIFWQSSTPKLDVEFAKIKDSQIPSEIYNVSWATIENHSSQIKKVILPDSSTVALFANSTIRYPKNFTVNAREIYLCGKAYFDVSKDPSRPFSVYAGVTKTTALGTSFTIDTRLQVFKTAVKLHTGKIVIASTNAKPAFKNVFLALKGESFSYNSKSNRTERVKLVAKQVDKTTVGSSKSMLLNIGSVPLPEVLHALQDAYQVKIKFGSSNLKHIMYTGSIDVENETLEDALTVICLINDLRYVVEKNGSYTIHPQRKYSINKNHK